MINKQFGMYDVSLPEKNGSSKTNGDYETKIKKKSEVKSSVSATVDVNNYVANKNTNVNNTNTDGFKNKNYVDNSSSLKQSIYGSGKPVEEIIEEFQQNIKKYVERSPDLVFPKTPEQYFLGGSNSTNINYSSSKEKPKKFEYSNPIRVATENAIDYVIDFIDDLIKAFR